MQKNKIGPTLHHLHKTWWGKNRQNHKEEIYIGFGNDFLHMILKAQTMKVKINKNQTTYWIMASYPKYIKNSYNSITKTFQSD